MEKNGQTFESIELNFAYYEKINVTQEENLRVVMNIQEGTEILILKKPIT